MLHNFFLAPLPGSSTSRLEIIESWKEMSPHFGFSAVQSADSIQWGGELV